jgi:pimeloyl-ACP methyl ester carboxylesterase
MLARPKGRIAYDVTGQGPLVVLVPGMGDLRATFRFLTPDLVSAGYRVATMDLRGHGDSDATFTEYGDAVTGQDALALVEHLGGPAVIVGNSMGAGSAVWAAAERSDLVRGLVLVGPFVRDPRSNVATRLLMRLAMQPAWVGVVWASYLPRLYAGRKPADFAAYRSAVRASVKQPGHAKALSRTTAISHAEAQARLREVSAPCLVVMGALDPDFPSPADEAAWIGAQLSAQVLMVDDAGHYPQSQRPDVTSPAVLDFLARCLPATSTGNTRA